MQKGQFWLRLFNVYPSEWWIVKRLFLLLFFQGAGAAFFFTSAYAQFLDSYPIEEMSWVLILSAGLLWLVGWFYTKFEHHYSFKVFNAGLLLFMAFSILLFRIGGYFFSSSWYFYFLLAWFNVLYMLNNLGFWGIAATHFDLRQSKRLFAVISAGDIPAKFLGYTLALLVVPLTGTANLLYLGAVCMLISFFLLRNMIQSGNMKTSQNDHHHHAPAKTKKQIGKLVSDFTTNGFVRRIAFISLLSSACLILINFGFYSEVRKAFHSDVELARFIAFFYAFLRVIALVTKMIFTGRLTEKIGVQSSLFITPVGMLLMLAAILFAGWMKSTDVMIFYLFGAASVFVEVLRTSFNSPVLLTLMQPLNTYERLRAHNIVKGIMDPFASLFCGIFILVTYQVYQRADLMTICYLLLILGILWMIGVVLVNKQYMRMLIQTISTRFFSQDEFDLSDERLVGELRNKIKTATEVELLSIMRMLITKDTHRSAELIASLLRHPSDQVRLQCVRMIADNKLNSLFEELEQMVPEEKNDEVRHETIKAICSLSEDLNSIVYYLQSPWEEVRKAAIIGMLHNDLAEIQQEGKNAIGELLTHTLERDKLLVIKLLSEVKEKYDHPGHAQLITDANPEIRQLAMRAIGSAFTPQTMIALWENFEREEKNVLYALMHMGKPALAGIKNKLDEKEIDPQRREKLIQVVGKIGGTTASEILIHCMDHYPECTNSVIRGLHRCKYTASGLLKIRFENLAKSYVDYAVELLFMQKTTAQNDPLYDLFSSSIRNEINEMRELLLCLFEMIYDRHKIHQVRFALQTGKRENISNAMEIIELVVRRDIGRLFAKLYESDDLDQRCIALRAEAGRSHATSLDHVFGKVLQEEPIIYFDWTKACSLYVSKMKQHDLDKYIVNRYINSKSDLIKETMDFVKK